MSIGPPAGRRQGSVVDQVMAGTGVGDQPDALGHVNPDVAGPASQDVAVLKQRGQRARRAAQSNGVGPDDHPGQPGMQGQISHAPAIGGRPAAQRIERAQGGQQSLTLVECRLGRGFQERQIAWPGPPDSQLQHQACQIDHLDFGLGQPPPAHVLVLGPQPVGHARALAAGSAGPLVRRRARRRRGMQPGQTRTGVVPR